MRNLRPQGACDWRGSHSFRCCRSSALRGFTLIELLVTLALLLVLTAMYWGYGSPSNQRRKKMACQTNLQKIYLAMEIYAQDSDGKLPAIPGARRSEDVLDVLVPKYTADTSTFICPGSKDSDLPAGESFRKRKISYAYYMGRLLTNAQDALMSDRQVNTLAKDAGQYGLNQSCWRSARPSPDLSSSTSWGDPRARECHGNIRRARPDDLPDFDGPGPACERIRHGGRNPCTRARGFLDGGDLSRAERCRAVTPGCGPAFLSGAARESCRGSASRIHRR